MLIDNVFYFQLARGTQLMVPPVTGRRERGPLSLAPRSCPPVMSRQIRPERPPLRFSSAGTTQIVFRDLQIFLFLSLFTRAVFAKCSTIS